MNKKLFRQNGLALLAMVMMAPYALSKASAIDEDKMEVKQAVPQFYSALNTIFKGEVGPMKHIWSHAPDVVFMGPEGGIAVGWPAVLAEWKKDAALKIGGQVQPENIHIVMGSSLAVMQGTEIGNHTNVDGKTVTVSIRVTSVFRKEGQQWLMIAHHTDLLPYLVK